MDELSECGIPARSYLKQALLNSDDPLKAIEEFQVENGILLPSLQTILPLLDLHSVPRLHFHTSVLEELREILLKQIEKLAKDGPSAENEKMNNLLEKSFPLIRIPAIQPIVMAILKNIEQIDDKYLRQIVLDREIYSRCDISVKRQIWQSHQDLFGEEVLPLFTKFLTENHCLYTLDKQISLNQTPRQRRQNEVLQSLVEMIGRNVLLYDTCLQFLRGLFRETSNTFYCTLRVDLLMSLHDAEISEITSMDPCHKFIWCLDACVREKNIDPKRSRELQGFLEGVKRGQEEIIGDLAMTLSDPYAIKFLVGRTIQSLNYLANTESLPRENAILILILRLLNLALHSWDIINSRKYHEPFLDPKIITKFLPIVMSLIVDDQVRSVNSKLPADDRQSALTIIEHSGPPPDLFQDFISKDRLAALIAFHYIFQVIRQKDRTAILRVLGCLSTVPERILSDNRLYNILVTLLSTIPEDFATEEFCTVVFDEIFLSNLTKPGSNMLIHLILLMHQVYKNLPTPRLDSLMKTLTACQFESDEGKQLMETLQEKVSAFLAETE
ncbi:negative elongation factor B [Brevipalpus obovatus]|uniref:negative elongation factor B n=1 Tax=Brevipalpus obovatus TaxID=246614 RepID=UPI003D9EBE22